MEQELLTAYIALLAFALIPIYIGSFRSLTPSSVVESIASSDAAMFPVYGSCGLFGLYLLFKFLPKYWINLLFSSYYGIVGIGAISTVFLPLINGVLPYNLVKEKKILIGFDFYVPYVFDKTKVELRLGDIIGLGFGSVVAGIYLYNKHWIANNIFGECISIVAIEIISLDSYIVGAILLIGLFFYDIFWVFGTDVMETVARSFEAPIKVVWPRGDSFSLLGLGDIVIPGIFVALMLRFDRYLAKKKKKNQFTYETYYFNVSFIAYILSLIVTVVVLHVFQHGQPALLYIVPFLLISTSLASLLRGEFIEMLFYKDKKEDKKEDKIETKEKEEDKKK